MSGRTGDNPSLTVAVALCGIPMVGGQEMFPGREGADVFKMGGGKAMLKTVAGGSLWRMMEGKNIVLKILS